MFLLKWIDRIKYRLFCELMTELLRCRPCNQCPLEEHFDCDCCEAVNCLDIHGFLLDVGKMTWIDCWEEEDNECL